MKKQINKINLKKWRETQKKIKEGKIKIEFSNHLKSKMQKEKEEKRLKAWANQKIIITCTMHEAGDLMDLLFMADAGPFNNAFRDTIKLNKMEKSYSQWLNRMVDIVCPEIKNARRRKHK